MAFIREDEIPAASAGTFLGDFRVRQQIAACREWPAAHLGPEVLEPVVSDAPVLALVVGVIDRFITAGSAEALDLSCVAKIRAVPFVLPPA